MFKASSRKNEDCLHCVLFCMLSLKFVFSTNSVSQCLGASHKTLKLFFEDSDFKEFQSVTFIG